MKIHIHQIYYLPSQVPLLDPDFIPYDNTANANREFAEYHVFEQEYRKCQIKKDALTGYVSWKFGQKTRLKGWQFIEFIKKSPGYDVYFVTPFVSQIKLFRNVWLQGNFYHPGSLPLAQKIFDRAGHHIDLASERHDASTVLYCNYWVGNKRFWDAYMSFTKPIVRELRKMLRNPQEANELRTIADKANNFGYIAFILERVFTTFINHAPQLHSTAYPLNFTSLRERYGTKQALLYTLLPDNAPPVNWLYQKIKKTSHELY